jgi:hypothetical protein
MAASPRHLTWEAFKEHLIQPSVPVQLRVKGTPDVFLFVTAGAGRIGLRTTVDGSAEIPPSPVQQLRLCRIATAASSQLEVSTEASALFREFFFLALGIADLIQERGVPALEAVAQVLDAWKALLQSVARMSDEEELGLIGELWTLARLHKTAGSKALTAWTGPQGEPHDFRLGVQELEVKSTVRSERVHIISGLAQLVPSRGQRLFILSLQFEPAGASDGMNLPDQVGAIRSLFRSQPSDLRRFERLLGERTGYTDRDASLYTVKYRLRTPAALIRVDAKCPRITRTMISQASGLGPAGRVIDALYHVNLDGLGVLDGSAGFRRLLP